MARGHRMRIVRGCSWTTRAFRGAWCWLRRFVDDWTATVGVLPVQIVEGAVGGGVFVLHSRLLPSDPGLTSAQQRLVAEARAGLEDGAAFVELGRAAARGAFIAAQIREEGTVTTDHLLVVGPRREYWR